MANDSPPEPNQPPPDRVLTFHQQRLRQMLLVLLLAFTILAGMNLYRMRWINFSADIALFLLFGLALWWCERGKLARAVATTLTTLLLGLGWLALLSQGLYDEAPMSIPVLLVFAGLFSSGRTLVVMTAGGVAILVGLYALHETGMHLSIAQPVGPQRLVIMVMVTLVAGYFVWELSKELRHTLSRLQAEKQALLDAQVQVETLVQRDALTGLPSRALAMDRLEHLLGLARLDGGMVAVLFLDLDNFKTINDSLGHFSGDDLLRQVGKRVSECVRESDTVARISGDEFLILLGELENEDAIVEVVAKVTHTLRRSFEVAGIDILVTASLGIAVAPRDGDSPDVLLRNADTAMYKAKEWGRNTFCFFDNSMNESAVEQLQIAANLRTAMANGELQLYYQPQWDLKTERICGAEALLRWRHPERGFIPPDMFIAIAERSGLIHELGTWVLRKACVEARAWKQQGLNGLLMAVNVSPLQFRRGDIEQDVMRALEFSGLDASALELELTESVLMADTQHLQEILQRLSARGVKIAIDDFGTGYSNLGYLRRFAVHRLKIDQSFVRTMCQDKHDEGLVRAVIEMAHHLDLEVVAEGVEDAQALAKLQAFGCEFGQGYHWSPALPAEAFVAYVRAHGG